MVYASFLMAFVISCLVDLFYIVLSFTFVRCHGLMVIKSNVHLRSVWFLELNGISDTEIVVYIVI